LECCLRYNEKIHSDVIIWRQLTEKYKFCLFVLDYKKKNFQRIGQSHAQLKNHNQWGSLSVITLGEGENPKMHNTNQIKAPLPAHC
jgi:hypothetical protein